MYAAHFGLAQPPFSIAPDPRSLYLSERHREALAHLLYGLGAGGGIVLLTGEIGAGKTTVARCFLEQVPAQCRVAYIFNPRLSVLELLQSICDEFGLPAVDPAAGPATVKTHVDALNRFLLEAHGQGRQCVLVIDEAQALSAEVLEQLRLLTNLETHERKLLQIVLIGQPELRQQLARPGLEQLAQRVIARYHLGPLDAADTERYVAHRLAVAGLKGASPFDAAALRRLQRHSGGVPRRINLLADRALLGAYGLGRARVDAAIVERAAAEVFDAPAPERPAWRRAGPVAGLLLGSGLGVAAALAWLALGQRLPAGPALSASAPPPAVAASASMPSSLALFDATRDWAGLPADEATAWRLLAEAWTGDAPAGRGEPCSRLRVQALDCWRSSQVTLALLRGLDRPGWLMLHDGQGRRAPVLLRGLGADRAWLSDGTRNWQLPLDQLLLLWRGEFGTLWRPPAGYSMPLAVDTASPLAGELAQMLARLPAGPASSPASAAQRAPDAATALRAFQLAEGLRPDGLAGPTSLMLLQNRLGEPGPRLAPLR
ncbi:MAG: AAA family ATPase [Burkholderiaceae bacterium]|nr:AAA family ATPase [Burkholderiaceae bacterium]